MLSSKELSRIKELIEGSQNPLFLFDDDADGMCSFIILQKAIDRGKGVAMKSSPESEKGCMRKINELKPDSIYILDKPVLTKEFIEELRLTNLPIIWIDHHKIDEKIDYEHIEYFNSSPSSEPVTYISQKIFNRKEDEWLAIVGCIADHYMPEFAKSFSENYPEFLNTIKSPFDSLFNTELGKIAEMINFGLKETTTNILRMIRLFEKSKSPIDILEENSKTKDLHNKYNKMKKQLDKLICKKRMIGNLILVEYSGEIGATSELSNKLSYLYPNKHIMVIHKKSEWGNVSIRGKKAREIVLNSIKNIDNANGGGHEEACGARIPIGKLDVFKETFIRLLNKSS